MRLLGLDHIAIVVRDINETVARAGDTVDGRAGGERILAGDIDLQFLLFGETRLELIEVRAAGFGSNAGGRRRGRRPHGQTILRGRYDGEFDRTNLPGVGKVVLG
jgi:hypothetical protein